MFVIPKKDLTIVDPQRLDTLPPEGRDVGADQPNYWNRRIADGDVTLVPDDKVPAAKTALDRADAARAQAAREAQEAADKAKATEPAKATPVTQAQK